MSFLHQNNKTLLLRFIWQHVVFIAMGILLMPHGGVQAFSIPTPSSKTTSTTTGLHMVAAAPEASAPPSSSFPPHLSAALKKASKTLTVHLEFSGELPPNELATLSMQARQLRVSSLWVSDPLAALEIVAEQGSSKGNFPGPCPIVWKGSPAQVPAGVDAVVVSLSDIELFEDLISKEIGLVFQVQSEQDVSTILELQGEGNTICYLVNADNNDEKLESILAAIPTQNSIVLVSMPCMQADNAELVKAKALQAQQGVHGIVLEKALVGDAEDIEYCTFAVEGLTKKQSSTFNMSGLTGSTNGHYGGVSKNSSIKTTWKRVM